MMTDAKYQRCFEVAPLEFLDSSMLGVQIVQVVCGGGAAAYDRLRCAAWFNPGYHLDWYGSIYWRGAQAGRVAPPAFPEAGDASSVGYRLPITWGSSPKH